MDPLILIIGGVVVLAIAAMVFVHYKSQAVAAVEAVASKTGTEVFTLLHQEIQGHQQTIDKAKADLALAKAKFVALQATVAQLVLPPSA
jgi:hypothetical protein